MDTLVPIFVAVLLVEMGSKTQALAAAYGRAGWTALGLSSLFSASVLGYLVSAMAGWLIGREIPIEARSLLFAVSLVAAGMFKLLRPAAKLVHLDERSMIVSIYQFARSQFGDDAQFLVFGIAAQTASPFLAAYGALAGVMAAGFAPIAFGEDWPERRMGLASKAIALLLGAAGFIYGIRILGLTGA